MNRKQRNVFFVIVIMCFTLCGCKSAQPGTDNIKNLQIVEPRVESVIMEPIGPIKRMEPLEVTDPDNQNVADMLQKKGSGMMVQIRCGSLLGSGVIFRADEQEMTILTAAHVLSQNTGTVKLTFIDGYQVESTIYRSDDAADLAAISVSMELLPEETRENCLTVNSKKEETDNLKKGDGCIAFGSKTDVAAEAYEGVVLDNWIYMEDYGQYMTWVKTEGKAGMSGGGLFSLEGYFLGILSGESEDGELAVVPYILVEEFIKVLDSAS